MQNNAWAKATGGFLLMVLLTFLVLVFTSPPRFLYDEQAYADYVGLLHRFGFTIIFLKSLTGAAGPLYSLVHFVFEPLTHLQPVRMRLVNVFLLLVIASVLAAWLKRQGRPDFWIAGCSVFVVPMTWVVAGMALTEMSAMVFVTLSLYLQLEGLDALQKSRPVNGWFLAAGVCLGIAVWGRQTYLLLVGVPLLLAILERRLRIPAILFAGVAMAFAATLFTIWGGLVPPPVRELQQGLSVTHGLISLGYAGICSLLLAPRAKWLPLKVLLPLIGLIAASNAVFGAFVIYPLKSGADRYLPPSVLPWYGNVCGSLLLSCGVVFLGVLLRNIARERADLQRVTVYAGLLLAAASAVSIAHQYSSRYTAMALPYLILAAQYERQWKPQTLLAAALGCGAGFLSLFGYFSH